MTLHVPDVHAARRRATPARDAGSPATASATRAFSAREYAIAHAIAETVLPGGTRLPAGGPDTLARTAQMMLEMGPAFAHGIRAGLWVIDGKARARRGRGFASLGADERLAELRSWAESDDRHARWLLRGLLVAFKQPHFDDAGVVGALGCRYERERPVAPERPAWREHVIDGRKASRDLELTCEVVVVGTGAGGGAAAYELARRGRAVLLVEAGDWHDRSAFDGRMRRASTRMYLGRGTTFAIGNSACAVWAGRAVGGSTVINSGTCYRAPAATLARWRERYGLPFASGELDPFYARVEAMLDVRPAALDLVGGSGRVVARGADALGLSNGPLMRNAPDCDGQGVCAFGCPTGAKRSSDVSWVPAALRHGAQLVTAADVRFLDIEGGRARGLVARLASGHTLRVRADAVVVAGGALQTPLLLQRSGACVSSGWLGQNLSVHPATKVLAQFDETIDMTRGIPQSWYIDTLAAEGIMCEGGSVPPDVTAASVPWLGSRFMELMAEYGHLASFGLMIQDHARGSVSRGAGGLPLIRYDMTPGDLARMQRGLALVCDVFLRAGAKRVLPFVHRHDEVRSAFDVDLLRRARLTAGDVEVTAFHPLGTCRMGTDPRRSCVGPDGEAHDTARLFVADGSAVPSSLGVNPQMTIMALALRAAEQIDATLDEPAGRTPVRSPHRVDRARRLAFSETMRGTLRLEGESRERACAFTVDVASRPLAQLASLREAHLRGTMDLDGVATRRPAEGTLGLDLARTRRIPYALTFVDDRGRTLRLSGEKTLRARSLLRSMTVLPVTLETDEGVVLGRGELRFDLRDLPSFVGSARLARSAAR